MKTTIESEANRRRLHFTLRSVFLCITLVGIVCIPPTIWIRNVHRRYVALREVLARGATIQYSSDRHEHTSTTFFQCASKNIKFVRFVAERPMWMQSQANDQTLELVSRLDELEGVIIQNADITNAGLRHIKRLKHLRELWLIQTQITDEGVKHLYGLRSLRYVNLRYNNLNYIAIERLSETLHPNCKIVWCR